MTEGRCAVIILAAGYSSRMGRFKPLIKLGGMTVADRLLALYKSFDIEIFLVTGWKRDELLAGIQYRPYQEIENSAFAEGMFSSVKAGLESIQKENFQSFIVQPVDIPLVRPFTLQALLKAQQNNPRAVLHPVFNRRRGHPSVIPLSLSPAILEWPGDGGLKGFLSAYQGAVLEVNLPDSNILFDIDTPADLPQLEERFKHLDLPSSEERRVILNDFYYVSPVIQRHCEAVARLAVEIGAALKKTGLNLDLDLIQAAAEMHDLCKGQPQHETAGAAVLSEMGFTAVAEIIANHSELGNHQYRRVETMIVYLADKYMLEDRRIPLAERYNAARRRFNQSAEALEAVERRRTEALLVKAEFENRLGYPLEKIVFDNA